MKNPVITFLSLILLFPKYTLCKNSEMIIKNLTSSLESNTQTSFPLTLRPKNLNKSIRNVTMIKGGDLEFTIKEPYFSYAFWITGGIGGGYSRRGDETKGCFMGELAGNFRSKNKLMVCVGVQEVTYYECSWVKSKYLVVGKSFYKRSSDLSFLWGISHNQYDYETGVNWRRKRTAPALGINFIINGTIHFPHVFGIGLKISININKELSYISVSLNPCLGTWNIK